jgi:hypothetical protein
MIQAIIFINTILKYHAPILSCRQVNTISIANPPVLRIHQALAKTVESASGDAVKTRSLQIDNRFHHIQNK